MADALDSHRAKQILIVDDDEELLGTFRDLLTAKGYQVETRTDGAAAVEAIQSSDFDVVLCDLMMPNMTGDQVYSQVKTQKPEACSRFIFITGYEREPRFAFFLSKTDAPVLTKPVTSFQLGKKIAEVAGV